MEDTWLRHAKRLLSIAGTGLEFTKDEYDKERYEDITSIALQMLSEISHKPIARIKDVVSPYAKGYVTPKIDVRAAIFQDDQILLVKEVTDELWTLPGGYADVGLSPAENVEKEVQEEAGITVKASHLYSIRHKAKGDYDADIRDFYKLFFLCESCGVQEPSAGHETSEAQYFSRDDIPPLSTGRVLMEDLLLAWEFSNSSSKQALFD
jgi:ADP-ribose pyrophosphatase YjhB (NUDIX family)